MVANSNSEANEIIEDQLRLDLQDEQSERRRERDARKDRRAHEFGQASSGEI